MNPGIDSTRSWAGPRVGLNVLEKRKFSSTYRDSNPGPSSHSHNRYTDQATVAPKRNNNVIKGIAKLLAVNRKCSLWSIDAGLPRSPCLAVIHSHARKQAHTHSCSLPTLHLWILSFRDKTLHHIPETWNPQLHSCGNIKNLHGTLASTLSSTSRN